MASTYFLKLQLIFQHDLSSWRKTQWSTFFFFYLTETCTVHCERTSRKQVEQIHINRKPHPTCWAIAHFSSKVPQLTQRGYSTYWELGLYLTSSCFHEQVSLKKIAFTKGEGCKKYITAWYRITMPFLDISSLKPDFQRSTPGIWGVCIIIHFHIRLKFPIPVLSSRTFCNDVNVLYLHLLKW